MKFFKSNESLGIIFAISAYFSFSILDAIQKTAVINHSIFQLLLIKYCFVLLINSQFYSSNPLIVYSPNIGTQGI